MKYKETDIQWLGKIPEHWDTTTIKNHFYVIPSNVDKKTKENEIPVELCNYVDVYYNDFIDLSVPFMEATANENEVVKFQLKEKDVLITKDSEDPLDIGVPALINEVKDKLLCGYHLSMLRSKSNKITGDYLFWLLKDTSIASQLWREATGVTRWAIASRHVKNSIIALPPKKEQIAIANYLDKACKQIDKIIKIKEEQLISLDGYKESFIIKVLSEGLDNSKNLIKAESQWFSKYPKHWRVRKIKRYLTLLTDYTANGSFASLAKNVQYLSEGHARIVRLTDLRVDFKNNGVFIDEHAYNFLSKTKLYGGELLIANVGAYTGHLCIMPEVKFKASLAPNMMLFDVNEKLNKKYLYYFLLSKLGQMQFKLNSTITAQPKMNKDQFRKTEILEPPIDEQNKIVEVIENFLTNHESLISSIESQIKTLKNYRKSLIHECVTGKKQVVKAMETVKN